MSTGKKTYDIPHISKIFSDYQNAKIVLRGCVNDAIGRLQANDENDLANQIVENHKQLIRHDPSSDAYKEHEHRLKSLLIHFYTQ